jgi:UPF0176 protein
MGLQFMSDLVIAALYKFVSLPDFEAMRDPLRAFCEKRGIKGTLLLAHEGINGTISGTRAGIDAVLDYLRSDPRFADIEHKESFVDENTRAFYRLKIKLKKEIVTIGIPDISPTIKVGTYVKPQDWNSIISDPDVVVLDTRNDYEVEVGTFERALDPQTESFRQFPDYVKQNLDPAKHKKVAMFCTGGIRCEKASAYMLDQGFEEVFHLQGGILKYLEEVPKEESLWRGECFVFDNRVSVDHTLDKGSFDLCHGCRHPLSDEEKQSPHYEKGVMCPHCYHTKTEDDKKRLRERQKQIGLAAARGQTHMGVKLVKKQHL